MANKKYLISILIAFLIFSGLAAGWFSWFNGFNTGFNNNSNTTNHWNTYQNNYTQPTYNSWTTSNNIQNTWTNSNNQTNSYTWNNSANQNNYSHNTSNHWCDTGPRDTRYSWCSEEVAIYHCELEVEHSTGNCDCYEGCYAKYIYNCHPPNPGCEDCKEIGDEWEQRNCDTDNCCIKMWAACCDNTKCQSKTSNTRQSYYPYQETWNRWWIRDYSYPYLR